MQKNQLHIKQIYSGITRGRVLIKGRLTSVIFVYKAIHWALYLLWFQNTFELYMKGYNTIHMYSGITSGRVLNGELLYTKILEVNFFAFAYRLFRRDFSPLDGTYCMGTHSFLQLYMYFELIWEGFMNG